MSKLATRLSIGIILILSSAALAGTVCTVPDNGNGTATLPPVGCEYTSPDEVFMIIDGLPPGTTIEMEGVLKDFICCNNNCSFCSMNLLPGQCEMVGGSLGGNGHCFLAVLELTMTGTGNLAGFNRFINVLVEGEVYTGPRTLGDLVQTFPANMIRLRGEIFGDPDFDYLRVTAGSAHSLPSPGQTTLTENPGQDFNVDSFFDITYTIEFTGAAGSVLDGMSGTTQGTVKMETGNPQQCEPLPDQSGCAQAACPIPDTECVPHCMRFDPVTGRTLVIECACQPAGACYVEFSDVPPGGCIVPDNGTGTATLPPLGCEYLSPDEVFLIIDGPPPGTTIEMAGVLTNFMCCQPQPCPSCSLPLPPGVCEMPGGSLGGDGHCFHATLELTMTGTGALAGFNRYITLPVTGEVHTGPRNPGDPVQSFATNMYRLQGDIFGDPDFDMLGLVAGTDYGLPSPGLTDLTQLPSGDFNVDSFFDITYQVQFQGAPGSILDGFGGTTTATIKMQTERTPPTPPNCAGRCPTCDICVETITPNPDGTINVCCQCLPDADLNRDGNVDVHDLAIMAHQWLRP